MMLLRAAASWLVLLALAVINGALREATLTPRLGERAAHVVSSLLLSTIILGTAWLLVPWIRPVSPQHAWAIGGTWVTLTVAFEFLAGHYLFRNPWSWLLADYNLTQGRIWILVLVATLVAPVLASSVRSVTP